MRSLLFGILCFCVGFSVYGQKEEDLAELIRLSEEYYGSNDALYYGKLYRVGSRLAYGHPFFETQQFEPATIFIRGQKFENIPCRLDLENDLLIAKLSPNGIAREIILSPAAVDSFYLISARFINGKHLNSSLDFYYEDIENYRFNVVKAYDKQFVSIYNQTYPRGRYGEMTSKLLFIVAGEVIDISTNKKLANLFFDNKTLVKVYLKEHKLNVKKASTTELKSLFNYISSIEKP